MEIKVVLLLKDIFDILNEYIIYLCYNFRFIYIDDVDFNFSLVMKLFKVVSKYGIEDLKKLCFNKMKENIFKENVCFFLKMVYDTNC